MLIDRIIKYSNKQFLIYGDRCGNTFCNHPSGKCSGSCYNCLYQIHFPGRFDGQSPKEKYDCPKMLYHYVCQYSYLYTSELLCALEEESQYIDDFPYYHILSLGCGGCADLMAFDLYRDRHQNLKAVSYVGIDVNQLWQPIHEEIYDYCRDAGIQFQAKYDDVFKLLSDGEIRDANIVVISYLISYLYNTNQIQYINSLAEDIGERVVKRKKEGQPLLLIINDVNSNRRGRDYFSCFKNAMRKTGLTLLNIKYKYFDIGNLNDFQRIVTPYNDHRIRDCMFNIPPDIKQKYNVYDGINQTVQLMLEVI